MKRVFQIHSSKRAQALLSVLVVGSVLIGAAAALMNSSLMEGIIQRKVASSSDDSRLSGALGLLLKDKCSCSKSGLIGQEVIPTATNNTLVTLTMPERGNEDLIRNTKPLATITEVGRRRKLQGISIEPLGPPIESLAGGVNHYLSSIGAKLVSTNSQNWSPPLQLNIPIHLEIDGTNSITACYSLSDMQCSLPPPEPCDFASSTPTLITTEAELQIINDGDYIRLNADINITPAYTPKNLNNLMFDGNGHEIRDLRTPLFNRLNGACIRNLNLNNATLVGPASEVGVLASRMNEMISFPANVSDVNVTGGRILLPFDGGREVDGLLGYLGCRITPSSHTTPCGVFRNNVNVNITAAGSPYIGGVLGGLGGSSGIIDTVTYSGTITSRPYVGGIVGAWGGDTTTIKNVEVNGKITDSSSTGGIVDAANAIGMVIENATSTADIDVKSGVGGIVESVGLSAGQDALTGFITIQFRNLNSSRTIAIVAPSSSRKIGGLIGMACSNCTLHVSNSNTTAILKMKNPPSNGLIGLQLPETVTFTSTTFNGSYGGP